MNYKIKKIPKRKYRTMHKKGFVSSTTNVAFKAIKNSDSLTFDAVSETRDKAGQAKKTVTSGAKTVKKTYDTAKFVYKKSHKIYKLSENFYRKNTGQVFTSYVDVDKFKQKKKNNKNPTNKKDGLLSSTKDAFVAATKPDNQSVSDSVIGSVHTFRDFKENTEPVRRITKAGYKYVAKPVTRYVVNKSVRVTKYTANKIEQVAKNAAQKLVLKDPNDRIFKKKETTKPAHKNRNTSYKFKNRTQRHTKNSIKKTSSISKKAQSGSKFLKRAQAQAKNVIKLLRNPLFIKGGAVVFAVFLLISVINTCMSAIAAPLSFFMADANVIVSYQDEMNRLDSEFSASIANLKTKPGYDDYVVNYMNEDGATKNNWKDILSILSVKYDQNLTGSAEEIQTLTDLFYASNKIVENEDTYQVPMQHTVTKKDKKGKPYTETTTTMENRKRLIIQVYSYDLEDLIDGVGFNGEQKEWARQISTSDFSAAFPGMPGMETEILTSEQIAELIKNAPKVNVKRDKIIETALSLVGKVDYFWGGKSSAGWNSNWGKSMLVTASGSKSTNTYRPYGLDCSGFVDWVYKTSGVGNILSGGGSAYQWSLSYPITDKSLLPGDLVFKNTPNSAGINHVGIFYGNDSNGKKLFIHCASSSGVTVNSYTGFKYWRRVSVKLED